MISEEEIKTFLEGNDPEEHIVAIEFDLKRFLVKEKKSEKTHLPHLRGLVT